MEPNQPAQPQENPAPETAPAPPTSEPEAPAQPEAPVTPGAPDTNTAASSQLPSAFSLFKPSTDAFKLNWVVFVLLYVVAVIASGGPAFGGLLSSFQNANNSTPATTSSLAIVWLLVGMVVSLIIYPAITYTQLRSAQGQKVAVNEALSKGLRFVLKMIGLLLIMGIFIGFGFLLLIVPGVILLTRWYMAPYVLLDQDTGVLEALRRSSAMDKGHGMAIWGLVGVMFLIAIPSIVPFVGWIATAVLGLMYYCAPALRYFQLKSLKDSEPAA